jgi:hypothetical protein
MPEHIREALIHDPRVAEQDLDIHLEQRRVVLGGNVASPEIRAKISEVAGELLPDYEIVNRTVVVPSDEPDGEEPIT